MPRRPRAAGRCRRASAPSESSSAPFCMGTRSEELAARLAAGGPGGVGGPAGGGCGEGQHERVVALREIKNQTFGNQTKKLLYLRLGAVLAVVTARHQPCSSMSGRGGVLCLRRRRWRACRACCWSRGAPPRPPRQQGQLPSIACFLNFVYACSVWGFVDQLGEYLLRAEELVGGNGWLPSNCLLVAPIWGLLAIVLVPEL